MLRTRIVLLAAAIALGLVATGGASAGQAQSPAPSALVDPALQKELDGPLGAQAGAETVSLIVRLRGASVSQQLAAGGPAVGSARGPLAAGPRAMALKAGLVARQAPTRAAVLASGAQIIDSYQTVTNGFLVHARRSQVPALARIPGVERIERAPQMTLQLSHSIPQIGATRVWQDLGWDGTDTVVAVIDTGIDYTHKDFGGAGTEDAFSNNDPRVVEEGSFPTAKVVAGYDFVGEIYSATCLPLPGVTCTSTPEPDDDPLDAAEVAHGTHVAGITAGMGVESTDLGKGAAPGAALVALKVFGNPVLPAGVPGGDVSTDVVVSAIEWATEANLDMDVPGTKPDKKIDVMNLSLGAPWGGESLVGNEAVDAAIEAGITVVMAAGNSGDIPLVVSSSGTAAHALSVASSVPEGIKQYWVTAEWTENGSPQTMTPDAVELAATGWQPTVEETGRRTAPLAWYGMACNAEDGTPEQPAQDVREKFALVERGTCAGFIKAQNAEKFGAVGIIVFTNTNPKTSLICDPCDNPPEIPGVMIDREPGLELKALVEAGTPVMATLDPENSVDFADVASGFSSRGPSRAELGIKPQITAPGSSIVSALAGTGTQSAAFNGTSMASPTVAGVAALLWQRNRAQKLNLDALDISALAMNYSVQVIEADRSRDMPHGPLVGVPRQGAGRIDAYRAATGNTLVRSDEGISELGFGMTQVTKDSATFEQKINVLNMGQAAKSYKLGSQLVHADDTDQGVSVGFTPATFRLEPGKDQDVTVTATVNPTALRAWDLRSHELLYDEGKLARLEIDGWVGVTEVDTGGAPVTGGDVATVPFYILPRRQSCLMAQPTEAFHLASQGDSVEQSWTNPCPQEATVAPVALGGTDPSESQTDTAWPHKVDIEAVGTTYGLADPTLPESPVVLTFTIATRGATNLPLDTEFRVYLDYDEDGKYDEVLFNALGGDLGVVGADLGFVVAHSKLQSDGITPDRGTISGTVFFQIYDITDQTAVLNVAAAELNDGQFALDGDASFRYAVRVDDNVDDYAVAGNFLGYDLAPDGMFDLTPKTFAWRQSMVDCLHLYDESGTDTGKLGDVSITIPANATSVRPWKLQLACQPPAGGADSGVMFLNFTNAQGQPGGYEIRRGRIGEPASSDIYLPYVSMNHVLVETPPTSSVTMNAVGEAGTAGTATLTQRGSKLEVVLDLPSASTDAPHPAHIHTGTCATPGGIYKDLTSVENGKSVTLLDDVSLASVSGGQHYINVHKSAAELAVAISCGDILAAP